MPATGYRGTRITGSKVDKGIIDTGTSLAYIPEPIFDKLASEWKKESSDITCNTILKPYCFSKVKTCSELAPKLGVVDI